MPAGGTLDFDEIVRPEIPEPGFVEAPLYGVLRSLMGLIQRVHREKEIRDMTAEIRHCEQCDHEFEVEVRSARRDAPVDGCAETTPDCGLTTPGEQVKVVREID